MMSSSSCNTRDNANDDKDTTSSPAAVAAGASRKKGVSLPMSHEEMDSIGQIEEGVHKQKQRSSERKKESNSDDDDDDNVPNDLEPLDIREPSSSSSSSMKIQPNRSEEYNDDDDDDVANDLEALLGENSNSNDKNKSTTLSATAAAAATITGMTMPKSKPSSSSSKSGCCCSCYRIGNIMILNRSWLDKTGGYGIIGPHWFGPPVVMGLLGWASHHFIHRAKQDIGSISTYICYGFLLACLYFLFDTCYKDPGIVPLNIPPRRGTFMMNNHTDNIVFVDDDADDDRWCDFCNASQPSDGAHCPDCNVCIAGYDHHCVWMGVCIGKKNIKSFMRFNMCWLLYLLYSIFWVSAIGPIVTKHVVGK